MKPLTCLGVLLLSASLSTACGTAPCPLPQQDAPKQGEHGEEETVEPAAAQVRHLDEVVYRTAPGGEVAIQWLASGNNAYMGRLLLAPGTQVPPHRHDSEEFLFILEGGGVLTIEGVEHELQPGTGALIPLGSEHSYVNGPVQTVALQVFSSPEGAQRYLEWEERALRESAGDDEERAE